MKIIAKIEKREALRNLRELVEASDAVMVARGDLGVELHPSLLPGKQKEIIALCNGLRKPVITATQMMESMVKAPSPTRAEVTDIANAVLDGSDALMLSAETASGKYPVRCVKTMRSIIRAVERESRLYYRISMEDEEEQWEIPTAMAASASLCALKLQARLIVCLSTTGKTAITLSSFRPKIPIIAVSPIHSTLRRLQLVWGIQTLFIPPYRQFHQVIRELEKRLYQQKWAKKGDCILLTLGQPVEQGAKTNSLQAIVLG